MENTKLEGQIRRLNQSIVDYQTREKEFGDIYIKYDDATKLNKRQDTQLKTLELQLEESSMTIKMLKNKVENQSLKSSESPTGRGSNMSTDQSISDSKVMDVLKKSVKEKNTQIEELTKRNKLLMYQLDDMTRSNKRMSTNFERTLEASKSDVEKQNFIKKMNEMSKLLMNEEGEKLRLSEENFALRQILKEKGIDGHI